MRLDAVAVVAATAVAATVVAATAVAATAVAEEDTTVAVINGVATLELRESRPHGPPVVQLCFAPYPTQRTTASMI